MTIPADITECDLLTQAQAIRIGDYGSEEILEACLDRISRFDPILEGFSSVDVAGAREAARRADTMLAANDDLGPLHGIPIAIKDLISVAGQPLEGGSRSLLGHIAETDAKVVSRLREAGAVIIGKTNTHELGIGRTNWTGWHRTGRNPWNVERVTTGSSSGSAVAVAAGMCSAALGTDTGGSIRLPSAHCGLTGLKPTYGRLDLKGILPMCHSLDHVGPMARSAADAATVFAACLGKPSKTSTLENLTERLRGMRLASIAEPFLYRPEMSAAMASAYTNTLGVLASAGVSVAEHKLSSLGKGSAIFVAFMSEAYREHAERLAACPEDFELGTRSQLYLGALVTGQDYANAKKAQEAMRQEVDDLLEDADVLILPAQFSEAPGFDDTLPETMLMSRGDLTAPFSATGHPAVVFPCGYGEAGLPLSVQIVGQHGRDEDVLAIAAGFQQLTEFHLKRPDSSRWIDSETSSGSQD